MRVMEFDRYGGPEVLHEGTRPEPHPGPGQVRVRTTAVGVNPYDWKVRSGAMAAFAPVALPHVPGSEAVGVVDELGEGVEGVAIGDRVLGSGSAATAEHVVLRRFVRVPEGLSDPEAAALPAAAETAARALGLLGLGPGDLLVVDGAAGGVGTAVVQLAVARGIAVVGTASTRNHDHLRELGAAATTYGPGLPDRVRALTGDPVTGALDLAGRGSVPELVELAGDPHRVLTLVDFGAADLGVQVSDGSEPAGPALEEVAGLVTQGRFRVVLDEVLPWTAVAQAHARSQEGHARGKLVLRVD
ncbi:NADP-dependent oxidoreductase [Nocardioides aurantiacus]|uniref:NADP-dependent oxidoreductase n=1 Tax=Nocardioides aurantiacus TaxID=86796 RepID=UPI00403EF7BE